MGVGAATRVASGAGVGVPEIATAVMMAAAAASAVGVGSAVGSASSGVAVDDASEPLATDLSESVRVSPSGEPGDWHAKAATKTPIVAALRHARWRQEILNIDLLLMGLRI
jgi:hypothetical protein